MGGRYGGNIGGRKDAPPFRPPHLRGIPATMDTKPEATRPANPASWRASKPL